MTLQDIADNIRQNGRWGRRSQRSGEWKWMAQDRRDLKAYLENLGVRPRTENPMDDVEYLEAKRNIRLQVEWMASHGA